MSEQNSVSGKVERILEPQTFGNFTMQEIWIGTDGKYPKTIPVSAAGDKMKLLEGLRVGDDITAYINIGGRKNKDGTRAFPSLTVWKIESDSQLGSAPQTSRNEATAAGINEDVDDDGCPF